MWHFDQLDCFSGFEVLKPFKQKKTSLNEQLLSNQNLLLVWF